MNILFSLSLIFFMSSILPFAQGAEKPYKNPWTLNYQDLSQIELAELDGRYLPFATLKAPSSRSSIQEIFLEICPASVIDARALGIKVRSEEHKQINSGLSRIAINFHPPRDDFSQKLGEFLEWRFGKQNLTDAFSYYWSPNYCHPENQKSYAYVSFPFLDYEKVHPVLEHLGPLCDFSPPDYQLLLQIYQKLYKIIPITF